MSVKCNAEIVAPCTEPKPRKGLADGLGGARAGEGGRIKGESSWVDVFAVEGLAGGDVGREGLADLADDESISKPDLAMSTKTMLRRLNRPSFSPD